MTDEEAQVFWTSTAKELARIMKNSEIKLFCIKLTERGTYEFEVLPITETPTTP